MGWQKPGPGRPVGSRNQYSLEREQLARDGLQASRKASRSPLAVLLARMDGDQTITDEQFAAAAAAAPYVHPRLAATEATIRSDNVHRVLSAEPLTPEQWLEKHAPKLVVDQVTAAVDTVVGTDESNDDENTP